MDRYNDSKWIRVPLKDVVTPKEGYVCKLNRWWAVLPNEETGEQDVLFFRSLSSPQSNPDKSVVVHLHPTLDVMFISVAYVRPYDG